MKELIYHQDMKDADRINLQIVQEALNNLSGDKRDLTLTYANSTHIDEDMAINENESLVIADFIEVVNSLIVNGTLELM